MPKLPVTGLDISTLPLPATLPEAHQLIRTLAGFVEDLRLEALAMKERIAALNEQVADLKEQLSQSSGNSSKPPSQDTPEQRAKRPGKPPTGNTKGAQPGHAKHERMMVEESQLDGLKHYYPEGKCSCGGTVVLESEPDQQHQVFDLPEVRYTVVEHRTHVGCCTGCGKRHKGRLPDDVPVGQMGPGLIAWIGLMNGGNRLSTRALQALLAEQWGLHFSLGAISEAQGKLAEWLEAPHEHIGEVVKMPAVTHADETSHFRYSAEHGLERHWLWTLTSGTAVYFMASFSRGKRVAESLLKGYSGVLVTDRLGSYGCYPQERRQVCLAHIIRNLTAMSQRKGDAGRLGDRLVRLLQLVFRLEHGWRRGRYSDTRYQLRLDRLQDAFHQGIELGSGWTSSQKTMNQCKQLLKDESMLWTFRRYPNVPLTNNAAERAVRPYVIWRKTSFFSQSARGDRFRERILSVTESCKRLRVPAYDFLRQVCEQGIQNQPVTVRLPFPVETPALA